MEKDLTKDELKYIHNSGPIAGCKKVIIDRCISNVDVEKRPFHCVDISRDKFAIRIDNEWIQDWKGKQLLEYPIAHFRKLYNVSDMNTTVDDLISNSKNRLDLELHYNKKILKEISKLSAINNDITKIL